MRIGSVVDGMGHAVAEIPSLLDQDDPDGPRLAVNGELAEPFLRDEGATDVVGSAGDSPDHRAFWKTLEMIAAIIPLELG
jgi:hypothetical protein